MEINKLQDVEGVVTTEAIVEGRMVLFTSHSHSYDFGSRAELPGIKLPDTAAEAARAFYVAGFALDNSSLPLYIPTPAMSYALRGGFDQAANVPFSTSVYFTHQSNMVGQTIPASGLALAYAGGTFTVPSGAFIYNANLLPGNYLVACNTDDDGADSAGKLKYSASAGVAKVHRYDSVANTLTFRTLVP